MSEAVNRMDYGSCSHEFLGYFIDAGNRQVSGGITRVLDVGLWPRKNAAGVTGVPEPRWPATKLRVRSM